MLFGYNSAPAHFQNMMSTVLNAAPAVSRLRHAIYVDVHLGGDGVLDTWQDTLEAIRRLMQARLLINAWKLWLLI